MAEKCEDQTLELPLDIIKASPGFSFDIGSSITKLIYRSKEDFENGEPKNVDTVKSGVGIVREKLIPREKFDDVITYIKENCDLTRDSNGGCVIHSTGAGGNLFRNKIEEELNITLKNLSEFDCFAGALTTLLKTKSAKDIFKPLDQKGADLALAMEEMMGKFKDATAMAGGKGKVDYKAEREPYDPETDERFPFLLAMCGSGFGFVKVEEDGTFEVVGGSSLGGRFFLGLISYLTDITDFDEISKNIMESNGKTADVFCSDVFDPNIKDDIYSAFASDVRLFALAKGISEEKDKTTKGDLIHSILESLCENTATLTYAAAMAFNVPRIYFAGNFVNTPKAQTFLTKMMRMMQKMPGKQVNFEFLQNGGLLGAIGAFTEPYNLLKNKAEEE